MRSFRSIALEQEHAGISTPTRTVSGRRRDCTAPIKSSFGFQENSKPCLHLRRMSSGAHGGDREKQSSGPRAARRKRSISSLRRKNSAFRSLRRSKKRLRMPSPLLETAPGAREGNVSSRFISGTQNHFSNGIKILSGRETGSSKQGSNGSLLRKRRMFPFRHGRFAQRFSLPLKTVRKKTSLSPAVIFRQSCSGKNARIFSIRRSFL